MGTELLITALYGMIFMAVRLAGIEFEPKLGNLFNVLSQLWTIFVIGFIMHRALEVNIGLGISASLIITIFSQTLSIQMASLT